MEPEIVHVHENHDPRLLGVTAGYVTVLTVHDPLGHPGAPELTRGENWVFRRWFVRAQRFVVHGQALVEELAPIVGGDDRIVVIPHGTSLRTEPLRPPDAPTVLLFGRLEAYKGVEVLVEAMRRVAATSRGQTDRGRRGPGIPSRPVGSTHHADREIHLGESGRVVAGRGVARGVAVHAGEPERRRLLGDRGRRAGGGQRSRRLPELAFDPSFVPRPASRMRSPSDRAASRRRRGRETGGSTSRSHFSWEHAARLTTALYRELARQNGSALGKHHSQRTGACDAPP